MCTIDMLGAIGLNAVCIKEMGEGVAEAWTHLSKICSTVRGCTGSWLEVKYLNKMRIEGRREGFVSGGEHCTSSLHHYRGHVQT